MEKSLSYKSGFFAFLFLCASALTAQTVSFTYDQAGNRTGRTSEAGGVTKSLMVSDSVEMNLDPDESFDIRIYPNPTFGIIDIVIESDIKKDNELSIINMTGVEIFQQVATQQRFQIDLSPYPPGNYFIRLKSNSFLKYWKIMKL